MTSTMRRSDRTLSLRDLTASSSAPVATVVANLMPAEVLAKRRLGWLRRRLMFGLIALVLLVALAYAFVQQQTASAEDDLGAAQSHTASLDTSLREFDKLTVLQGQIAAIKGQLAAAMTGDLRWSALITTLNSRAPSGLVVTGVHGSVEAESSADPNGAAAPDTVGTLEVSGTAKDYRSIATFVEAVAKVPGLVQVDPGSVTSAAGRLTFTVAASLTKAALGGRFASAPSAPSTPSTQTPGTTTTGGSR